MVTGQNPNRQKSSGQIPASYHKSGQNHSLIKKKSHKTKQNSNFNIKLRQNKQIFDFRLIQDTNKHKNFI